MQKTGDSITISLRASQCLALKMNPKELIEIWYQLVLRGFLERVYNSLFRLALRKNLVDAELTIETVLKEALHSEAVFELRKKKRNPKSQFCNPNIQKS